MRCVGRVRESCQRHDIACVCCGSRERERERFENSDDVGETRRRRSESGPAGSL